MLGDKKENLVESWISELNEFINKNILMFSFLVGMVLRLQGQLHQSLL